MQKERELYRKACEQAKSNFEMVEDTIELDKRDEMCSLDANVVYLESCEAIPRQVNYLIDEASEVGKGANIIISYVHHYFENHGLGETCVHLHANNCSGQNKNNYFIWYLALRTINQLHHSINYSFCIADHTKFGPDRCFGIIQQSYKVNLISSIHELARMVDSSSTIGINKAQLVGTHNGRVIVRHTSGNHSSNSTSTFPIH